jgi:hypothetical protein
MAKKVSLAVFFVCSAIVAIPSFFFPDSDISLLGIKYHRFFLFHSAIIPFALYPLFLKIRRRAFVRIASIFLSGFSLGVGAHLLTDVIPRKTVNFLVVNTLIPGTYWDDRLWIVGNMVLGFILVGLSFKKYYQTKSVSDEENAKYAQRT